MIYERKKKKRETEASSRKTASIPKKKKRETEASSRKTASKRKKEKLQSSSFLFSFFFFLPFFLLRW